MEKFKLAHTTKSPKIAKPIQKPRPKFFQKKIKELLTGRPDSSSNINQESAMKLFTDKAGVKVKDRLSILASLEKKKFKASKKKVESKKSYTNSSEEINIEQNINIKRTEDNDANILFKKNKNALNSPKKDQLLSLGKQTGSMNISSETNASNEVKKLKGKGNTLKQPKSSKAELQTFVVDDVHKGTNILSKDRPKEHIFYDNSKCKSTTDLGQFAVKKSKKIKSLTNKKEKDTRPKQKKSKGAKSEVPVELDKNLLNKDENPRQNINETVRLYNKAKKVKTPTLVCKKPLSSKDESKGLNPLFKIKKKAKKRKISSEQEEVDSGLVIQESEPTSELMSGNCSFDAECNSKKCKKKRKKNHRKSSDINASLDTDIRDPNELNNNTGDLDIVSSHFAEHEEKQALTSKKKKTSKKKQKSLVPASSIHTYLEDVPHSHNEVPDIGTLHQQSQVQESIVSTDKLTGFDVEVIEIPSSECNSPKESSLKHEKVKENIKETQAETSKVSAPDALKKLQENKTKNRGEKHIPTKDVLEAYDNIAHGTEEPKRQSHNSAEQPIDSIPHAANKEYGGKLPSVLELIYKETDTCPQEGIEIHSVIQQFIPDKIEAENITAQINTIKNKKSEKQTAANDAVPAKDYISPGIRSKSRKRKLGEDKHSENSSKEDIMKNKIPSEPLIICGTTNLESFQISKLLESATNQTNLSSEHVADVHSPIQYLLGKDHGSFFESSDEIVYPESTQNAQDSESYDVNLDKNTLVSETYIKAENKSPMRRKDQNESTVENQKDSSRDSKYLKEEESSANAQNISEPLLIEMTCVELPPALKMFQNFSTEPDSNTEELHSNSLLEHFIPVSNEGVSLEGSRQTPTVSSIKDITVNKRTKTQKSNQEKQLHKTEYYGVEEDSVKFYSIPGINKFLLFMKYPSLIYFKGKLTVSVLSGIIEILGYTIKGEKNFKHNVYSPKGSSLMSLQTCESDENDVVNYEALKEKLDRMGIDTSITKEILTNLGQRDCLVMLEEGPAINLEEFVKRFPSNTHFFDVSKENLRDMQSMSCFYKAQKKLGCVFELPSSAKSFRRYTKSPQWDTLVGDIISCYKENLKNGPVSTVVCGGKGVGKSTFLRYFVNKCITEFEKILWLDFDPGQAEFVMPGCVAAIIIDEPLLGPNFTHLRKAERMIYVGDVNINQCPIQYLESVAHVINYCHAQPKLRKIPWLVNTMGFCKGLGVDLTASVIRLLNPHKVVQIQSESFKRNFPQVLYPEYVSNYHSIWQNGPTPGSITLNYDVHVINTMTDSRVRENTGQWGMEPRRLREAMILSYLSQMAKPPYYSLFDIVPYVTRFHRLTLCICHKRIQYDQMLSAMNGNLVGLCCYEGNRALVPNDPELPKVLNHQPICPCLGFGIVRGIDAQEKTIFIITPVPEHILLQVNCLMMGAIMLPAYSYTTAEKRMGHVPYVSAGPGQPTSKVIRRFFRPLEEKTIQKE